MNKLTLLVGTFCFAVCFNSGTLASEIASNCNLSQCKLTKHKISNSYNSAAGSLTEAKWQEVARRYYQSRMRSQFMEDNHLLSLWDVQKLIGFSGKKVKITARGNRQYWVWTDSKNPSRQIKATFIYYQLIDLKGSDFNVLNREIMTAEALKIRSNSAGE